MYRNPDEFSEYHEDTGPAPEIDYANPEYYRSAPSSPSSPISPASAQAVQTAAPSQSAQVLQSVQDRDPDAPHTDETGASIYDSYTDGKVHEYRGPQSLEGYTTDVGAQQREATQRGEAGNPEGKKSRKKGIAGIGSALMAIGALLLKVKVFWVLLQFGWAGITALISVAAYAFLFGWSFAIGLVIQIFIHEMGHALVMKLKGIPIGGLTFIPLLGAAVTMRQMPQNARDGAEVGIAGPLAGALAAGFCLYMAQLQPHTSTIWIPLAYFGFFINLFNLIPVLPLDGAHVLEAIDRRVWIIVFVGLLGVQIWSWLQGNSSWWLLFLVFIAGMQLLTLGVKPRTPEERAYYDIPVSTRIALTLLYFGLAAVLYLGMTMAQTLMPLSPLLHH